MKILFILMLIITSDSIAQSTIITPPSNLIVQGIPDIPSSIKQDVSRYTESRSAAFVDWHPLQKSMLIATRFANVPQLHMVKLPMGSRKQMTFFEDAVTSATWEPVNGKYFLFNKDIGGNEFSQIFRYDIATGNVTLITDGGRSQNGGIIWSHTGRLAAYGSTKRNGADRDIYILDPAIPSSEKMAALLSGGGWGVTDWSRDDKQLLLSQFLSASKTNLWLLDIASGKKIILNDSTKEVSYSGAKFSKDGKGLYLLTNKDNEFSRIAYMDLTNRKLKFITTSIPWDVDQAEMSNDGKHIAFATNEAGESKLYLLNTITNTFAVVKNIPPGVYASLSFNRNNKDLAITVASARSASDIYTINILTGKAERWTESELGGLVPEQLPLPSLIKWKSFDGREISGFYYKPAAKFTGKRPVVINIHGGPEGQSRPGFMGSLNYFMNEMGVAEIFPNVRGSQGYGKTFLSLDNGFKREESVKDIGALIEWVGQQPELDASRIMVTGGSYGGYMTLAVATNYNEKIRCALDVVGISNFNTFLKNTESYRRDLRRAEYGDERDSAMSAFFERIAPLNNVNKITKPLFIVQGTNDPRVPRTEAEQMASKVKSNGGDVWYLEAKDEGHGFRKKTNTDFQRFATILFMQKYLIN